MNPVRTSPSSSDNPAPAAVPAVQSDAVAAGRMLDELVSRALAYCTSKELKELFEFSRRFPHLAPFNAMLLHVQNPGIRYVLRASHWERDYRRRIRPGARPYVILQTMGPVAFVFDLGDTEPLDYPSVPLPKLVLDAFPACGQPPPDALPNSYEACKSIRIEVTERDYGTGLAGCVERVSRLDYDFSLRLNANHTAAKQLGTLAHELGHVFCGHLGKTDPGFWPDRRGLDLMAREFEAEAVAYLVATRMALDVGSETYLAYYFARDQRLPNYSLDAVLKAAGKVEEMAAGRFRPKRKKEDR